MWSGPIPSLAVRQYAKYQLEEVKENYADPSWWSTQFKYNILYPVHRLYTSPGMQPVRVMDEQWDVLMILDACRADLFEETADMDVFDEYTRVNSGASSTHEWTKRQFNGDAYHDTVYISAQPVPAKAVQAPFHAFLEPWRETPPDVLSTPPELVAETTLAAAERYPNKRLLVHFFQPHFGPPETLDILSGRAADVQHVWEAVSMGIVDAETVWTEYRQNLRDVLGVVNDLIEELDGRIVISSDHGNLLGDRIRPFMFEEVGHPGGLRHPDLIEVPWATIARELNTSTDEVTIDAQLSALGYV